MLDVLLALTPALAAALWFFGWNAARLAAICVGAALVTECTITVEREDGARESLRLYLQSGEVGA